MSGFRFRVIAVILGIVVGGSLLLAEIPESERDAGAAVARADAAGPLVLAERPQEKLGEVKRHGRSFDRDGEGPSKEEEFTGGRAARDRRREADRAEPRGRRGGRVAEHLLRKFDRDGDGKLALDELPESPHRPAARVLAAADQDGDGLLDEQEIARALARFDRRGGDGGPPAARERRGPGEPGRADGPRGQQPRRRADSHQWPPRLPGGPPMADRLFAVLDRDDDRELSIDEIDAAAESLRELDRDGDGRLCKCELAPERYEGPDRYRLGPRPGDRRPPRRP